MANILSYIKTIWKAGREGGTAWTPERLNNIESGIEQATNQINTNSENIENIITDINDINNNLKELNAYLLINGASVTSSSDTNISTYQSRKISDYQMLLFTLNYSINDIRQTLLIPTSVFAVSGMKVCLSTHLGTLGTTTYTFNQMTVKHVNDTTISASLGSGACKILYVYGIKLH